MSQIAVGANFPPQVTGLLQHFGFTGDATGPQPRADALDESLRRLLASPNAVEGFPRNSAQYGISTATSDSSQTLRWNNQLAPDFKRAAFEIYQEIKAASCITVHHGA